MPAIRTLPRAALLAGPTVLAFSSGGFEDHARLVALVVAAVALGAWAFAGERPWPSGLAVWLAIGGFAGLCGWAALSAGWAPMPDVAHADVQRVGLYVIVLVTGATIWRSHAAARAVEPVLAAGILVVIGYALAGRLLPGIVHVATSSFAGDRLFQPLTYWNALGALGAMGFVLTAHLAGDRTRPRAIRLPATAAAVPIGAAVYLTLSRGALAALAAGLIVLLALAPTWSQLRAVAITLELGALGAGVCAALPAVGSLGEPLGHRETQGGLALAALLALMLLGLLVARWATRVEREERTRLGRLPLPPRSSWVAAVVAVGLLVVPVLASGASGASSAPAFGTGSARLGSIGSNRPEYWRVALHEFADHPLKGTGSGGFRVTWLQRRTIDETVRDAHSLYLETATELGLVGLLLLALAFAGVGLAARAAQAADPALAAGPCAALAVWALHAGIDWDWEMPALTLVAVVLAGLLLSRASVRPAAAREHHAG